MNLLLIPPRQLLNGIVQSHQSRHRDPAHGNNFRFHLVISLAHEIVHLFVGYLTGDRNIRTPPLVTTVPYREARTGESGRLWEDRLLGGGLETWFLQRADAARLGTADPGLPYIFLPTQSPSATAWMS